LTGILKWKEEVTEESGRLLPIFYEK